MIYALIIGCEIAFWVFIVAGLTARYLLKRRGLGAVLLAMTPLVDLILLIATAWHLQSGGTADFAHSLAAIYLGFSLTYGRRIVAWADVRFARRFAGGPAPEVLYGRAYAIKCWKGVPLTALAVGIAAGLLWLLIIIAPNREQVVALQETFSILGIVLAADIVWAVSYTIWPKQVKVSAASE